MIMLIQSMCETVPCLWATLKLWKLLYLYLCLDLKDPTHPPIMMVSIAPVLTVHWVGHKGFEEGKPEESHFSKVY